MSSFKTLLPAVAIALITSPVLAQETAGSDSQSTEPRLPNQLDTGEVVAPQGQRPSADDRTYVRETNGDWDLQCLRVNDDGTNSDEDPCQMYQLLSDENGSSVAEISLFRLQGSGNVIAGGTFVVPLETLLTEKLTIAVDGGQAKRYDFSFCTPVGCYARVGFSQADINAFRAGAVANVTIVPALAPDQKVVVPMSLTGFTASYEQVTPIRGPGQ